LIPTHKQEHKEKMKSKRTVFILLLALLMLAACGKSEFGLSENTGKKMTISAENAGKDAFFAAGSLEVDAGERIVLTSDLSKGSIRVEIIKTPDDQSIGELPAMDGEAIISANLAGTEGASGTVPAGAYLLKATCLEKATGTILVEAVPDAFAEYMGRQYSGEDPWGNPLSIDLISMEDGTVSYVYKSVIGEDDYLRTFLAESSGELIDGVMPFQITAAAEEDEATHLDYSGSIALTDGRLFVTYDAGAVTEESPEGGSAAYQAPGLEGDNKTVILSVK
jgi:hypothetical protein